MNTDIPNILLIIIDCLRYDYLSKMPFLSSWARNNVRFDNHWSNSHCTDPGVTTMLTGVHPDEIGLYSMLAEHKNYEIPARIETVMSVAKRNGYETIMFSPLGRWYNRGVDNYVMTRNRSDRDTIRRVAFSIEKASEPWFMVLHTTGVHSSVVLWDYESAVYEQDAYMRYIIGKVISNTRVIVTADHGEGVGDKGIQQHGHGLWDFLTHIPLIVGPEKPDVINVLTDQISVYEILKGMIFNEPFHVEANDKIFQVGDTPPNTRHRGVVYKDGKQYIVENKNGVITDFYLPDITRFNKVSPFNDLVAHCTDCGVDLLTEESGNLDIFNYLKGIGYFD